MLHVASAMGVPDRLGRYTQSYHHAVQNPMLESQMRAANQYPYGTGPNMASVYPVPPQRRYDYGYQANTPNVVSNAPPSPPIEDANKPSLPSISSLLEISDSE